ncbi:hypothetical protein M0804_007791 [Polistes exclamans]|nr:hypothetical protein M0804_007791 [Polistes exclamans]
MSGKTRGRCSPGARTGVEFDAKGDRTTVQMILVLGTILVTFLGFDGIGHTVVAAYPAVGHVSTSKIAFHPVYSASWWVVDYGPHIVHLFVQHISVEATITAGVTDLGYISVAIPEYIVVVVVVSRIVIVVDGW